MGYYDFDNRFSCEVSVRKISKQKDGKDAVLKKYYKLYLFHVRGLKESTIRHYFNSIRTASRFLLEKNLIRRDIYEIGDLQFLYHLRDILYADPEFIELDRRGNRMYSAGLNNYCHFAEGSGFLDATEAVTYLDVPVDTRSGVVREKTQWQRSNILRVQALAAADYSCEVNPIHKSFIARKNDKPYMEGHHLIPLQNQKQFEYSLDVYANIVCLCPVCHRMLHYGRKQDVEPILERFWIERYKRFEHSGLSVTEGQFMDLALKERI